MLTLLSFFAFFPVFLVLHCLFLFLFKKWLGPVGTFYSSALVFGLCLLFSLNELYVILSFGNYYYIDFGRWFFCLDLIDSHLVFCIDGLALVATSLVLTLTVFALYFGVEYMYREAFINRLLYLLNLFATSVVFLFFSFDYFLIIFSWECIGLFSLLLVNFYSTRIYTIKAALKTFVFSRISDAFMFISFILSLVVFNTTDLSLLFLQVPFTAFHHFFLNEVSFHFLTFFATCIVLSGGVKAAQFFSHVWLPDAMEAPTPASALIHSSTLVVAGVFLVIRFSLLFEFCLWTNYLLALLGALTLSFGAVTAVFQHDIKKLVAYSTISQIGYLVCGCGFCCYEEVLIYLIIHALNKAFLFVLVGYTVHFFNANTDMRQMGGAYLYSYDISVLLFGACLNLAGLPYSAGFLGKEFLLFQIFRDDFISTWVRACWLVSFFFTPIYMLILVFVVSYGIKKGTLQTYSLFWNVTHYENIQVLKKNFTQGLLTRFQFSIITSRPTIYVLFLFWCFFFFSGELLLLLTFNYNSLSDLIPSSHFLLIKTHVIFFTTTSGQYLGETIFMYILFFTTAAVKFLLNLRYTFDYQYLKYSSHWDLAFLLALLYLFIPKTSLVFLLLLLVPLFFLPLVKQSYLKASKFK